MFARAMSAGTDQWSAPHFALSLCHEMMLIDPAFVSQPDQDHQR